jgi:hypothetical protein
MHKITIKNPHQIGEDFLFALFSNIPYNISKEIFMKQLKKILPVQSGYYLEPEEEKGFLSVLIPEKRDNYIPNPTMFDTNNTGVPTGYTKHVFTTMTKITGGPFWLHHWKYEFTSSIEGVYVNAESFTVEGGNLTVSMWLRSDVPSDFRIMVNFSDDGGAPFYTKQVRVTDSWQQYSHTFPINGTLLTYVDVQLLSMGPSSVYIAAMQLEVGKYPTTLIHGYMGDGYKWLGTPFVSPSRRLASVSTGGRRINLKDLGMRLTSIEGLGIPDNFDHSTTELAFKYGSKFNGMAIKDRDISIEFTLYSTSLENLLCTRNKLGKAIFKLDSPVTFIWQPRECATPQCEEIFFTAVYKSGFSLGLNSHFGEEIKLSFTNYDITMRQAISQTHQLNSVVSLVHPAVVGMDYYGNLKLLPPLSSISPAIFKNRGMVISPYDGNLYAIFDDGGPPFAPRGVVLRYNGSAWTKIAQGTTDNGAMTAIFADKHYIYVAISNLQTITGQSGFTGTSGVGMTRINLVTKTVDNIGSLSSTDTTARNGVTSVTPRVRAFAVDDRGYLFIAGAFVGTTTATAKYLAMYDGVTWYETGAIFTSYVGGIHTLYFEKETKRLYFGGDQMSPSFVMAPNTYNVFAYLDLTDTYIGVGEPVRTDFPIDLAAEPALVTTITKYKNRIVLGGKFRSSYGFDQALLDNLAYYDISFQGFENVVGAIFPFGGRGNGWGIDDAFGDATGLPTEAVSNLTVCDDTLYISGKMQYYGIRSSAIRFDAVGEVCGAAKYVSTAETAEIGVMLPDIVYAQVSSFSYAQCYMQQTLCGSEKLEMMRFYSTFLLSGSTPTVTSYVPQPNVVTVCQTDLPVSPRFILRGPGRVSEITNQTYGLSLYFDYTLQPNEIVIIDLEPSPPSITSSLNGDILYSMLPASTPGAFKLFPGDNSIIVKATWNTVDSNTLFAIQYNRTALAAESLCCDCE